MSRLYALSAWCRSWDLGGSLIALGVSALSAWMVLQSVLQADHQVALGNWIHPDTLSNHWLLVWVVERILSAESFLHNPFYYWPVGDAPVLAGNGMAGLTYLPFHLLWGWPQGTVWWGLMVLIWNGMGAWVLSRAAGASRGGGWLAAALVAAHPYVAQELNMGHFSQADLGWLLVSWGIWIWILRGGDPRWGWAGGVTSAITAALYWYHGVFLILAAGLTWLLTPGRLRALPGVIRVVGLGGLLITPWALVNWLHMDAVVGMEEVSLFPHPHAVSSVLQLGLPWGVEGSWQAGRVLPPLLIPLLLVGARRERAGLAVLIVGLLLALGPATPVFECVYGSLTPLRRFWWPYRHAALMLGAGALILARCWPQRWSGAALLIALSIPFQLSLTGDLERIKPSPLRLPPPVYPELAELEDGVVLEPPLAPEASTSNTLLIYQLWHQKPLLGGHAQWVDRVRPDTWDAYMKSSAFLSSLTRWEAGSGEARVDTSDLLTLLDSGVRWLVLNPEHFHRRLRHLHKGYRILARRLFGKPVLQDSGVEVFDMQRWKGVPARLPEHSWPAELERSGPEHAIPGFNMPSAVFPDTLERRAEHPRAPQPGGPPARRP